MCSKINNCRLDLKCGGRRGTGSAPAKVCHHVTQQCRAGIGTRLSLDHRRSVGYCTAFCTVQWGEMGHTRRKGIREKVRMKKEFEASFIVSGDTYYIDHISTEN